MKILGSILIGVAILIFVTTLVLVFTSPGYFGSRYLRKLMETEFRKRSKPLVSTADADTRFVQVIPRANWAKLKLIDATDVGFLRVDKQRGELLFEGDKECYRIPAAAITSCEIETFIQGQGSHGATTLYRVVLQANHPSGFWEAPFAQCGNSGKYRRKSREKWALALQGEIRELMFTAKNQATPV
jgi:hypothetical protein